MPDPMQWGFVTRLGDAVSRRSVRTLLIGLVFLCVLPGIVAAAITLVAEYRDGRAQLENDTIQTARALVQAVDNQIMRAEALALGLATATSLARGDLPEFHEQAQKALKRAGLVESVVLVDKNGRQMLNTQVEYGKALPFVGNRDLVRRVFRNARPAVSDLYVAPVMDRSVMSVAVPVFRDSIVIYVLVAPILPERFRALLSAQEIPDDRVIAVFDGTGIVAARTRAEQTTVGRPMPKFEESFMAYREGVVETAWSNGVPVLSFFTRSAETDWGVAIEISRMDLEAPLIHRLFMLAFGGIMLFALGLSLAWWMGTRIARSFQKLVAPATALGSGEATTFPEVEVREAAELADAMGKAADVLNKRDAALRDTAQVLAESEKKYRTLFANMTEAFGLGEPVLDAEGNPVDLRFLEVNEAFYQQTGIPRGFVGQPMRECKVLPKLERVWIDRHAAVALTGKPDRFDSFNADTQRHYEVYSFSPVPGRFAILFRDVTSLKRTERALQESESYLRQLIETLPGIVWTATPQGDVDFISGQWMAFTGTTEESQLGSGFLQSIHEEDRDNVARGWREVLDRGARFQAEYRLRRHDGTYRWFNSRGTPIPDRDGQIKRWLGIMTDVHDMKLTQEELRRQRSLLQAILDTAPVLISIKDLDYKVVLANRAIYDLLDLPPPEQLIGRSMFELFPPEYAQELHRTDEEALRTNAPLRTEDNLRHRDGVWHNYLTYKFPVRDIDTGALLGVCAISTDITERKIAEQRVRHAALHDPLTGLPNRALVFEYGHRVLASAAREHSRGALLFIDLDRFKPINDLYGHEIGDRVLKEVAKRLEACTRAEDLVGRLGGDEFVVLLPQLEDGERAAVVARHIVDSISEPYRIGMLEVSLSPSIGIAFFPEHAGMLDALIHAADLAMYQAKQSGRANYRFYTPALEQRADEAYSVEARLKKALRHGGLALHYQPVVDIRSGRLLGAEALARLVDGGANDVGPDRFIPVAESAGLIGDLGEWVLGEACRQHGVWLSEGLDVPIAINVSPLQFRQKDFANKLKHALLTSGTAPSSLQVEVTESAVMESYEEAVEVLNSIKLLGVKIALDDFGTGYSSLASLSCLPLDKLKVDQSFVRRLETDQTSRAVTEAIIALGRTLKLDVIGEGIETEGALRYLEEHGCDEAQGFWVSKPLPALDFALWCRAQALH